MSVLAVLEAEGYRVDCPECGKRGVYLFRSRAAAAPGEAPPPDRYYNRNGSRHRCLAPTKDGG